MKTAEEWVDEMWPCVVVADDPAEQRKANMLDKVVRVRMAIFASAIQDDALGHAIGVAWQLAQPAGALTFAEFDDAIRRSLIPPGTPRPPKP